MCCRARIRPRSYWQGCCRSVWSVLCKVLSQDWVVCWFDRCDQGASHHTAHRLYILTIRGEHTHSGWKAVCVCVLLFSIRKKTRTRLMMGGEIRNLVCCRMENVSETWPVKGGRVCLEDIMHLGIGAQTCQAIVFEVCPQCRLSLLLVLEHIQLASEVGGSETWKETIQSKQAVLLHTSAIAVLWKHDGWADGVVHLESDQIFWNKSMVVYKIQARLVFHAAC